MQPCPDPTPCYQPVLPCCNPQCPTPILPKQRPICPRAPPAPYPCLPLARSCCKDCEYDPVTRRRPLIVHDSVFQNRPSGLPVECFTRRNPNVRYIVNNYVKQVTIKSFLYNLQCIFGWYLATQFLSRYLQPIELKICIHVSFNDNAWLAV